MRYFFDYFYFHKHVLPNVVTRGDDRYINGFHGDTKQYPFSHAIIHTTDKVGVSIVCPKLPPQLEKDATQMP